MEGIKDMLSPPCQNMGGIHPPPSPPGFTPLAMGWVLRLPNTQKFNFIEVRTRTAEQIVANRFVVTSELC